MFHRRSFLQVLSGFPLLGGFAPAGAVSKNYFQDLGVRTFINAAGTYTALTASLMPREAVEAMSEASRYYVNLNELQDAVGKRIASMLGVEAAMVTSGAAGALTCGTAACITGKDAQRILRLPDLTGMKSEVLVQKSHRYGYDHAVRACGVKMIEIESAQQFEEAVNERTAMMLFFNDAEPRGQIQSEEWVRLGRKHGVPTFNDAAADVPPVENLWKYNKLGFDLVTFSGGKGLMGPQSAGLLLGRRDLIEAARLNTSPNSDSVARGMKVNKEEMIGMLVALELYLKRDHEADRKEWDRRVQVIVDATKKIPSVQAEIFVPPIANHVPHLKLRWDQQTIHITPQDVMKQLREGQPAIEPNPMTDKDSLALGVWMMQPGDAETVARRVAEILKTATA